MPELPEVEVVRRGLAQHVAGRRVRAVGITGTRVARRHLPGPQDLAARLSGQILGSARRRGKYLWIPLSATRDATPPSQALLLHLGMSGQLLVRPADAPDERHLHARVDFDDAGPQLRFVDQRTFGALALGDLDEHGIPLALSHVALDPIDPAYDPELVVARLKARRGAVKRGLLDQTVVSGIGNIYADEALWRAGIHGERDCATLTRPALRRLLEQVRQVMLAALAAGGTSFDRLYVDVNGASGYFSRSLAAYGQAGMPCARCGASIRREAFMNRSSYCCPRCQPRPRPRRPR